MKLRDLLAVGCAVLALALFTGCQTSTSGSGETTPPADDGVDPEANGDATGGEGEGEGAGDGGDEEPVLTKKHKFYIAPMAKEGGGGLIVGGKL